MKNNHKFTLWFSLILVGVLLCWVTPGFAEIARNCTNATPGTCVEIKDASGDTLYIVKTVTLVDGNPVEVTDLNDWPEEEDGSPTVFHYWGGVSDSYSRKPSAWSYIVLDLGSVPLDADPPGAQLPLEDFICGENTIDRVAYKLNPSVNFKNDAVFSLYAPAGTTYDPCGNGKAYVLFGKNCSGGTIAVPHVGALPFVQTRRFECNENVAVVVKYDQCTGVPYPTVTYELDGEPVNEAVPYTTTPYIHAELGVEDPANPGTTDRNFPVTNMGPEAGTVLCTDSDPVFLWGDRGYFCSE